MDLLKIFSEIEKIDGEVYERFDTRRRVFRHMAGLGKTITAAAMPAMLSTMFNKAYGQTAGLTADMKAVLNLALQLEYLEFYFYDTGLKTPGIVPTNDVPAITIIRDDEQGHINVLKAALGTDAFPDPTVAAFDYTAGGKVLPFSSSAQFYATAQSFVDTGVRAYKGGAPRLMANKDVLTTALNIHSVEARHSSHVRMVRRVLAGTDTGGEIAGSTGNARPKSWVSLMENGGPKPDVTAPVYGPGASADFPGESNVTQGGVNVQTTTAFPTIPGVTLTDPLKQAAASESFDEPLDEVTVKTIARLFRSPLGVTKGLFA
jgi:hypothetical protein